MKWLNDDYVKFIRFSQMKMDGFTFQTTAPDGKPIEHPVPGVESGIVGLIINHSWLDNPTFRGMRQSLMRSFERIYVLDLHGSTTKKEKAPDGSKDENVFDIEHGVAISLFIKRPGLEPGVWRGDLWERGSPSIKWPLTATYKTSISQESNRPALTTCSSNKTQRTARSTIGAYRCRTSSCWAARVSSRSETSSPYISQKRKRGQSFKSSAACLLRRFKLPADVRDWNVADAQADILLDGPDRGRVRRILYRPFDERYTYYTGRARGFLGWPVERIGRNFGEYSAEKRQYLDRGNIGLITSRLTKGEEFRHVQVTDKMNEVIVMSSITSNNGFTFPLWLSDTADGRTENLSYGFRAFIDSRYEHHYSAEEILGYVYGVLHAPRYRSRYAEFLRGDFPRVPFPQAADDYEALSGLGWALIQAHLLRELPRRGLAAYHGRGDHAVEAVRYSPAEQAIWINKTQSFRPMPQGVWDFRIGGYQVLDKYLKSRRGRMLSLDEINHVAAVADSLAFTIDQTARIDEAYRSAFPDQN